MSGAAMEIIEEPQPSDLHPTHTKASPDQSPAAATAAAADDLPEKRKREREEDDAPPPESSRHPMWKTSLCSYYRRQPKTGSCSHGETCRYAHSEAELRPRPDKSWDPTSDRAKKLKSETEAAAAAEEEEYLATGVDESSLDKCLIGLPRNWASDKLKSFLEEQGVSYKTAKTKKGMSVGFVTFESSEQVKSAIEALNKKSSGGKQIKVADAVRKSHAKKSIKDASPNQNGKQTENHSDGDEPIPMPSSLNQNEDALDENTSVVEELVSKTRSARDVVTPLAHMSYSDQLEHKKNSLVQILKRLTRNARKACPDAVPLPDWIINSREIGGLPCKLEGILESPLINEYRNKCEFSVGYSLQGKCTVGFMLGNFREGVIAVEEPINCPNVSSIACSYAFIFQEFLQSSALPMWNRVDNTGFWRQLTVREGRNLNQVGATDPNQVGATEIPKAQIAEVMLIIQVCSLGIDEEVMKKEFEKMALALTRGAAACSPRLPLTSVLVQDHKGISNVAPADCPLIILPVSKAEGCSESISATEARIHDYISNLCFCISPTAFFQVNTLAAERLYSLAGDWADLTPDTLLFDICCGTGTIGLTLAHRVGMVVGIEMNESAVSDARRNAEVNGIKNCRFVCGKAEDVTGALLKEYLNVPQGIADDSSEGKTKDTDQSVSNETKDEKMLENEPSHDVLEQTSEGTTGHETKDEKMLQNEPSDDVLEQTSEGNTEPSDDVLEQTSEGNTGHETKDEKMPQNEPSDDVLKQTSEGNTGHEGSTIVGLKGDHTNQGNTSFSSLQQFKDVVAIVDPPRAGLHPIVIKVLRTHPRIRRLVYISCNPESLVANAIELCTPTADKPEKGKGNRGWRSMSSAGLARHRTKSMPNSEPFRPVRSMAVDLFPHTPHCEMVMLLER